MRFCVFPESSWPARHRRGVAGVRLARQQTGHRLAQLRLHHHGPEPRPGTPAGPDGQVVGAGSATADRRLSLQMLLPHRCIYSAVGFSFGPFLLLVFQVRTLLWPPGFPPPLRHQCNEGGPGENMGHQVRRVYVSVSELVLPTLLPLS